MSKTRMTKNEKRRLLLKKQARKRRLSRRALIAVIVLAFTLSGIVSLFATAFDGADYETAQEITFENGTYTVPESGLNKGDIYRYNNNGKTYVLIPKYDYPEGDTLTLNADNTLTLNHDPTRNAEPLTNYVDVVSSNNPYQFTIKDQKKLSAGQRYYYTPDGTNYYTFTPEEDIGYSSVMIRENGVYVAASVGNIVLTLDSSTGAFSAVGDQYIRHVIYEESDTLDANHVYLIAVESGGTFNGAQDGTNMLITYSDGDSKDWNSEDDNVALLDWSGCANRHYIFTESSDPLESGPDGHARYYTTGPFGVPVNHYGKEGEYVYTISATGKNPQSEYGETLYSYNEDNDQMIEITGLRPFYDGNDGTLENDEYVYNEFSTYTDRTVPTNIFSENAHVVLRAYDGDGSSRYYDSIANGWNDPVSGSSSTEGFYSSYKVLGGIYDTDNAKDLFIHKFCEATALSHNHGNVWGYNSTWHALFNGNASVNFGGDSYGPSVDIGYEIFLDFDGNNYYNSNYYKRITEALKERKINETYIYEMKDVYTKKEVNAESTLYTESNMPTSISPYELEDVTVTLSHSGTYAQSSREFDVTITLTDESGDPVPGKWSTDDLEFTNGVYSTTMKNGDSIPFTNIPKGYSLNVSVTLPDGSGVENALYYSATINGQAGTENDVVIDDDKQIPIVITDTRKKAHISLTYKGDNISNPNQTFPVTLKLTKDDADETPVSGTFVGTNASGYTFDNGECVASPMANNQSFDLYVPEGYKLTTTVTLPAENTEYYTSSVDETAGTTATTVISADDNIPIEITSVKEQVTITNQTEGNSEQDNYADLTKKFPLKLTLYNADGQTPMSGDFIGSDGTTVYHFGEDGVCSNTIELADDESISLYLPKNMVLKVEDAENPLQYTTSYTDPVTPDSENPLNTSISGNDINIVVTHTRNWLPPVTLFGSSNDNHYSFIIRMVLEITVAAGIIYLVFLKRKLRIQ